ncbi:MAG: antibiotic biosynthesis monooxygenase [Desulfobulbaceae bacterium]|nr:antibiotic biosynthesis monooxygenase [Desulfobulbaceae bacterium]
MIIMTLRFTVPPEKIADVIAIINSIKEPICVEPECKHFSLYSDINNDNALMLVGEWESQETLEEAIQMEDFSRIFVVLELASRTPEINFDTVSDRVGFELIEKLKG